MPIPTIIPHLATTNPGASLPTPDWTPWALIVAGVVLLALWGWGKKRSQLGAGSSLADRLLGRVKTVRPAAPNAADASDALGHDLAALTDHLCARLDEKAGRLEALLARAEAAIAALETAPLHETPQAPAPARSRRESAPLIEISPGAPGAPGAPGGRARTTASVEAQADPLSRRVYQLADEGRDPLAIARSLDEQVGKVQLILALRES